VTLPFDECDINNNVSRAHEQSKHQSCTIFRLHRVLHPRTRTYRRLRTLPDRRCKKHVSICETPKSPVNSLLVARCLPSRQVPSYISAIVKKCNVYHRVLLIWSRRALYMMSTLLGLPSCVYSSLLHCRVVYICKLCHSRL
jgi:hypothetical protein